MALRGDELYVAQVLHLQPTGGAVATCTGCDWEVPALISAYDSLVDAAKEHAMETGHAVHASLTAQRDAKVRRLPKGAP